MRANYRQEVAQGIRERNRHEGASSSVTGVDPEETDTDAL